MKKLFILLLLLMLGLNSVKSQVYVLGNALFPSVGVMVHSETMDDGLGFYTYGLYGHSNKTNQHMQNAKLGLGLTYSFCAKNNPEDCLRVYTGINTQIFWDMPNYIDGGYYENGTYYPDGYHFISFDIGVSKTFDNGFSMLIMLDAVNNFDCKVGFSYLF